MNYCGVIDTNVLVSALLSKNLESATHLIIEKIKDNLYVPIFSNEILSEYEEVLNRKEFKFSKYEIDSLINNFKKIGLYVNPLQSNIKTIDEDDQIFYDAYSYTKEDDSYLVTGNLKHYPIEDNIVPPRRMIDIIDERSDT